MAAEPCGQGSRGQPGWGRGTMYACWGYLLGTPAARDILQEGEAQRAPPSRSEARTRRRGACLGEEGSQDLRWVWRPECPGITRRGPPARLREDRPLCTVPEDHSGCVPRRSHPEQRPRTCGEAPAPQRKALAPCSALSDRVFLAASVPISQGSSAREDALRMPVVRSTRKGRGDESFLKIASLSTSDYLSN